MFLFSQLHGSLNLVIMHQTRFILFILFILLKWSACIEPYEPNIEAQASKKYIVSGQLTDQEGYQYVSVSLASQIDNPRYIPLNDCVITIYDDEGTTFIMEEYDEGEYRVWIGAEYLNTGTSYKLNIFTPAGVEIVSVFDEMPSCPDIGLIYYENEKKLTNNPELPILGIQFYIDVDASDSKNNNFKWDIEESWEYRTEYPLERYYDGQFHHIYPPDYSRNRCWSTKKIEDIYTLSVDNYNQNIYSGLPLHFVSNRTSRLAYVYSILVKQFALNEDAYVYWDQMRTNRSTEASLYENQPISIKGNLICLTNPDVEVLGFFGVTSMKSVRIFIKDVPDLELDYNRYCPEPANLDRMGWRGYITEDFPVYFFLDNKGIPKILAQTCVDCLLLGGTTEKPDYWPEDD